MVNRNFKIGDKVKIIPRQFEYGKWLGIYKVINIHGNMIQIKINENSTYWFYISSLRKVNEQLMLFEL